MDASTTIAIGIVGAGPRGLAVLERLHAGAGAAPDRQLTVHLIDPYLGRGGAVWRVDQSGELLMNTVAAQITMFADESVDCAGPIAPGPSLHDWARFLDHFGAAAALPAAVRRECRELGPDDYPSRALYGHYLQWVLGHLLRTRPPSLTVELHARTAVGVDDDADGRQVLTLSDGSALAVDAVVLTQGHVPSMTTDGEAALAEHAARGGHVYVPPGNPADVDLDVIAPGTAVALRGMGLNFFDHMALLTVGRGGRFGRGISGGLTYHPSGREPLIVAGSRRGVPYHARGENQKGPFGRHEPLFLTPEVIAGLRRRQAAGHPADFRTEVWPLIDREVRAVYYATWIRERWCDCDARLFLRRFRTLEPEPAPTTPDPFADPPAGEGSAQARLLERFGVADVPRWSWAAIARPYGDRAFADADAYRDWLLEHLRADVAEARRGNVGSPLKAALDAMRDLRNEIRLVVDHGGVSGDSYRDDLQGWYTPFNAFVSIGPPAGRIEQLVALVECGIVRIVGPGMTVDPAPDGSGFLVGSRTVPGEPIPVAALVEARLPEPDIRTTTDPLIGGMLARGECVLHRIPNAAGAPYQTGGLAVGPRPYPVLSASGAPHPRRFAFGVPTETVHWVTAAGIRPGVNSVILADADAVARAGVAAALQHRPGRRLAPIAGT